MTSESWGLQGLVLDVDDTLYMEHTYVASGFRAAGTWFAEVHGVDRLTEVALALFESGVRGDIFDRALSELGVPPEGRLVQELVGRYRAHQPDIELLSDARALIEAASERHLQLAVITDGPAQSQRAKISSLGIAPACDIIIVTSDYVGVRPKPDPSAFELIQERWGLDSDSLVYIGDNPLKDFVAPHELGWRTVRVRRQNGLHQALLSGDDVTNEVADLARVVEVF